MRTGNNTLLKKNIYPSTFKRYAVNEMPNHHQTILTLIHRRIMPPSQHHNPRQPSSPLLALPHHTIHIPSRKPANLPNPPLRLTKLLPSLPFHFLNPPRGSYRRISEIENPLIRQHFNPIIQQICNQRLCRPHNVPSHGLFHLWVCPVLGIPSTQLDSCHFLL